MSIVRERVRKRKSVKELKDVQLEARNYQIPGGY